ncbi:uncharacterized protein plekhg6 isoform X2 [Thalassophryne amazonica]|nr:uncharacterized protein plekhg6 isoform X2 [Thalassophryne amazonica]
MDETSTQRRDSVDGEKQREMEPKETETADGTTAIAETNVHHKGSAEKNKFSTFGYQRRTKQKVVTDFTTLSKGSSTVNKPRTALRQVLFNQGVSDKNPISEERGQLELLKHTLQTFRAPANLRWSWQEESQGTTLEKHWTDIVHSHSTMSKMQKHQQEALWEFIHTELAYINKLTIIKDMVIVALLNLHQHGFLLEVTPELLFSNLPSILSSHQLFWQEVVYPMIQEVRRTGKPFDPLRLESGCLQFHERFSSYLLYCWEEENNLEFARRQMEGNIYFHTYIQWVETHPQCQRMRLGDMQAKPHQRITKYPLLLKAVLKVTQDPGVQHALRGMLSSVNSFLESINDYLRLKDEELALSISAQRVEGYEVQGINEEIDKHVRDICQFDLTCPIRGVGPGVVRKLLLEENLKIRGRKDSKLEVVALLFSDVLLMTKVQKKGEHLKVVRPPLELDRTFCVVLKDGCSFVLVEVGELGCAMNVYIFAASTSDSCSTWVSTIDQAKETLKNLREIEKKRQVENWKVQQPEIKPGREIKTGNTETITEPLRQTGEKTFVNELAEVLTVSSTANGMMASPKGAEEPNQYSKEMASNNTGLTVWSLNNNQRKLVRKGFASRQQARMGHEWIEMHVRREQSGIYNEEGEQMAQDTGTKEQRQTPIHKADSAPDLDNNFTSKMPAEPLEQANMRAHSLLPGEYPDIDYPVSDPSILVRPQQLAASRVVHNFQRPPGGGVVRLTRRNSDSQFTNQETRTNSSYSWSGDVETLPVSWTFSGTLKSPTLRRRRPINTSQGSSSPKSRPSLQESRHISSASYSSDSDCSQRAKVTSPSTSSHLVLKLGSLKPNQAMFWNMSKHRVSPDTQTLSEPEMQEESVNNERMKRKNQRSTSVPTVIVQPGYELQLSSRNHSSTLPQVVDTSSGLNPNMNPSPLVGLLERAKERVKDRDGLKRDQNVKTANSRLRIPQPSPSLSTTPSPSPSDGDRDIEWEEEEEVELMRHRALTVSKGWKEQLVDGDEEDKKISVFTEGVNVDWPGWCFDDDVMDYLSPVDDRDDGLLEDINRTLAFWDLHGHLEQEDGEYSQV